MLLSLIDIILLLRHHIHMRTTISIDDDVMPLVQQYAKSRSVALGKAVSELVRRGLSLPRPTRTVNGLEVFDLPADSPRVTTELVRALENDSDLG